MGGRSLPVFFFVSAFQIKQEKSEDHAKRALLHPPLCLKQPRFPMASDSEVGPSQVPKRAAGTAVGVPYYRDMSAAATAFSVITLDLAVLLTQVPVPSQSSVAMDTRPAPIQPEGLPGCNLSEGQ